MTEPTEKPVLGYTKDGKPIHEIGRGYIATAAFVLCSECRAPIRSMGGPMYGALCLKCHAAKIGETK